jgi:hypothetical protein
MTVRLAAFLLAPLLTGCSRAAPEPTPKLSTWAEQFAAMEQAVRAKGPDFELVGAEVQPLRKSPDAPDDTVELRGHYLFVSPKSSGVNNEGKPVYPSRFVRFNDHRLAASLRVESGDEAGNRIHPPPPRSGERARLIRFSAQDVLRLTRAEAEAQLGGPVDREDIIIDLEHTDRIPPDVNALAVWTINYYRAGATLKIWFDAEKGTVLKRETTYKREEQPGATPSPSSKP